MNTPLFGLTNFDSERGRLYPGFEQLWYETLSDLRSSLSVQVVDPFSLFRVLSFFLLSTPEPRL